ncbi:JmjC domain-containing protein [Streptosporangium sp. V21-05]|uniref:JmjC domain-containing protein n=1 Tax=Streptosporangium sp. V21-05 TaxID=3446115 RepID=UPI003F53971E
MTEVTGTAETTGTAGTTKTAGTTGTTGTTGTWPLTVTAPGPAGRGASALASLVHPLDPDVFRTAYWQRRPLHVQGPAGRFRDLFTMADLREAVSRQRELGLLIRASGDHEGDGGAAGAHVAVEASDVAGHLGRGASICVEPIERAAPRIAELAARLKHELGHHGDASVKCYLSPHGYGFNTHFDAHVVTTLQLDGHKRWRLSRAPGVPFPLGNAFAGPDGGVRYIGRAPSSVRPWERPEISEETFAEVLLGPGDVLCLPAGTWHSAKAVGHSLAVNIAFAPADILKLLTDAVRPRLEERETWRSGLPTTGGTTKKASGKPSGDPAGEPAGRSSGSPPRENSGKAYVTAAATASSTTNATGTAGDTTDTKGTTGTAGDTTGTTGTAEGDAAGTVAGFLAERREELIDALRALPLDGDLPAAATSASPGSAAARMAAQPPAVAGTDDRRLQCVLTVANAEVAAGWYERVLGCRVMAAIPEFGWIELASPVPGVSIGLSEIPTAGVSGGAVLDFRVDDLERVRELLDGDGTTPPARTRDVAGVARFLESSDIDGNRLMFYQPDDDRKRI